jgi:hypothetical protein
MFHMDVAKIDRDVVHVCSSVRSNVSSTFLDVCCKCAYRMLQMFHTYVAKVCSNVSVVSVLCCNKCFHVASCKCFI